MENNYRQSRAKFFDLQTSGINLGLKPTQNVLNRLKDNPTLKNNYVHLAGTNGKGSVASIMALALEKAGYKVGLYTSPHLITFRERIQINREMISQEDVIKFANEVWAAYDHDEPLTFFEFITVLSFLYFKSKNVDWAFIETGMGGRLDATNLIIPKLTVITNITLDHTEFLGSTIAEIAKDKAGILKENCPLVLGNMLAEAKEVILNEAKLVDCPVYQYGLDFDMTPKDGWDFDYLGLDLKFNNIKSALWGNHQRENATLALASLEVLAKEKQVSFKEEHILSSLKEVLWPGRAEQRLAGTWPLKTLSAKADLILDGAHNPAAAQVLAEGLKKQKFEKLYLIFGAMADKDIAGILEPLLPLVDVLYLTRPDVPRAAAPSLLQEKITDFFGPLQIEVALFPELPLALEAAAKKATNKDLIVLSGSLFTVGYAKAYLDGIAEVESN